MFRDLEQLGLKRVGSPFVVTFQENCTQEQMILNQLNAPDPITGRPQNILAIYRSSETSPEVKNFIETHLLQRIEPTVVQSALDADDDSIIMGTPSRYESLREFDQRVSEYLEKDKERLHEQRVKEKLSKKYGKLDS